MATMFRPAPPPGSLQAAPLAPVDHDEVRRRMLLSLTGAMSDRIDDLVVRTGYEPAELINIAVALLDLSLAATEQGKQVGVAADGQELEMGFTGLRKNDPVA